MTEIIFEVTEDEVDGRYSASALGYGIHTQGDSLEEVHRNSKEAVACYFDDTMPRPKLNRLNFVRDEILVAWNCSAMLAKRGKEGDSQLLSAEVQA